MPFKHYPDNPITKKNIKIIEPALMSCMNIHGSWKDIKPHNRDFRSSFYTGNFIMVGHSVENLNFTCSYELKLRPGKSMFDLTFLS